MEKNCEIRLNFAWLGLQTTMRFTQDTERHKILYSAFPSFCKIERNDVDSNQPLPLSPAGLPIFDRPFTYKMLRHPSSASNGPHSNVTISVAAVKCASVCAPAQADAVWDLQFQREIIENETDLQNRQI